MVRAFGKTAAMENVNASDYLFLASAIAGRRVPVHVAEGPQTLASSDGQTIFLPANATARSSWQQVIAQAALIGAGSLEPQFVRKLVGRREAAQRYGYLEVRRATALLATRLPDAFLDLPAFSAQDAPTHSATDSLAWALSQKPLPAPPDYFGCVRPLMTLRKSVGDEGLGALTRKQADGKFQQAQVEEFDDDQDTEESRLLKLFQNPLSGNNPISDLLNKLLGAGVSKGKREEKPDAGGGAEMPVGRTERALRRGIHAVLAKLPGDIPDIDTHAESSAFAYPEWDVHAKRYKPAWAVVEEVEAWRADGARALDAVLRPAPVELKRQLGSLGLDHEMHRRQREGSELDTGRLLDCAIDFACGQSPSAVDVYRASRRTRRDLAVAVALDISGSTGETNAAGESVFDQQLQMAYQLGRTLNELGDTVALYGFHSWGRQLVRAVRLKGPEERWSARIADRFAQLEPVGYTRTGAAVRHGARLLQTAMRLPNRLLILITDGIAYDQDYESTYAESDARKALEEARVNGTAVVCLCIGGSREADKLRQVFGSANLLIVDTPNQITPHIRRVCRLALASVSRRRLRTEQKPGATKC